MMQQVRDFAGETAVSVINPRLARYGTGPGRRLACTILLLIVAATGGLTYINWRTVKIETKLVDQSVFFDAKANSGFAGTEWGVQSGLCGTYVNAKAKFSGSDFSRRIQL